MLNSPFPTHHSLFTSWNLEGADACRVRRRTLLVIVAHVPDRAIVGRVHRRLRVIFPAIGVRLRSFSLDENRLAKRKNTWRIRCKTRGEALPGKVRCAAERIADPYVAALVDRRTRHPAVEAVRCVRALLV